MRWRPSAVKTKAAAEMLKGLGVDGKTLLVDVTPDENFALSVRNIAGVRLVPANRVTARDVADTRASRRDARGPRAPAGGAVVKLTDVIRRPLVTEKTTILREDGRTLVFQVARDANKIEISHAVEQLFGSKVADVRTTSMHGKLKRQGRFVGRRPDWKKAYVRLKDGEKLPEFLEGA